MQKKTERKDTLDKYYKPANLFNKYSNILFWVSIIISFILLFKMKDNIKGIFTILLVIITLLYTLCNYLTSLYFLPMAEEKRKTHSISNAFSIRMDEEETNLFYNNELNEPIERLGAIALENLLFSKTVSGRMLIKETILAILYVLIAVFCILNRQVSLEMVLWISQTLFTTTLLQNLIKLLIFHKKCEEIYKELYKVFLNKDELSSKKFNAYVLDAFSKYECLKSQCGVMLSSKIFFSINSHVSKEWDNIKKQLNIHPQ